MLRLARLLDMFESYVGEEAFQKGVRLHMYRYADGVATGDDFFKSIADGSGNPDVVNAMKSFVDQPGVPLVKVNLTCSAMDDIPGEYSSVKFSQSRYSPLGSKTTQGQSWQIPVCMSYGYGGDENSHSLSGTTGRVCSLIKAPTEKIKIDGCPDWVMPNQNGSGYYRANTCVSFGLFGPRQKTKVRNGGQRRSLFGTER